jgi:hypothetical protein
LEPRLDRAYGWGYPLERQPCRRPTRFRANGFQPPAKSWRIPANSQRRANVCTICTPLPRHDEAVRANERCRRPGAALTLRFSGPCAILVGVSDIARA